MKPKGNGLLKVSGSVCMLIGIIVVFVGFYIMANGMLINDVTPDMRDEQLKTMKYLSAGGTYVMVMGAYSLFAGFVGYMNAANEDYGRKCLIYAVIMACFGLCNLAILVIFSGKMSVLNIVIVVLPILLAVLYGTGAYLNMREERK